MQGVRKVSAGLFSLALLLLPIVVWVQRQTIYDWWRLRNYQPPARVAELASATTMNDQGRKLFYVHHPELDDRQAFNDHCQGHEESIILGCYITYQKIYLFDVKDDRLRGVHEVTAAHEMLHAAYDRLSNDERTRVNGLLEAFFNELKNDRIKSTIESYRAKDPGVVVNELHSIIGTEVRNLTPELETYYKKYFDDRLRIVTYSEQYEQAFTERKNKIAAYDARLADLKKRINANESQLNDLSSKLTADRARMDALLAANQTAAYNAEVAGFNQRVRQYNSLLTTTKRQIEEYNQIVAERNAIALEEQALVEALDSRVTPQAEQ